MDEIFGHGDWRKMHHAYIVSGADLGEIWLGLEQNLSFKKVGNPDTYEREYETFGIEEARELSDWAIMKPLAGGKKIAAIGADSFTTEAQNALLKLFEEPPSLTYFFVIVPNLGIILPTLLSRVRTVVFKKETEINKKLDLFLESPVDERLAMIAPLIKSKDKEKVRNLIVSLTQKINKSPKNFASAKKILQAERYIGARGASLKMILEYLAVSL
jgi:DNA polymerase III gamma/tau subunit